MNITRRTFTALATAVALAPTALLAGCGSPQTYLGILIGAVQSILTFIGGPLADQIGTVLQQIGADVAAWKSGTIPQVIAELLGDLRGLLDAIPLGKAVDVLISIAISAIEALIGATGSNVLAARTLKAKVHPVQATPLKTAREFGHSWNAARKAAGLPASVDVAVPLF